MDSVGGWLTTCPDPAMWLAALDPQWHATADGCCQWSGRLDRYGYGSFRFNDGTHRRATGAHRAMWLAIRGDIPRGMVIDHLCRNRACVNVWHMELVTTAENTRRGTLRGIVGRRRSGCRAHGFVDGYGIRGRDGYVRWTCRVCRRERSSAYRARRSMSGA